MIIAAVLVVVVLTGCKRSSEHGPPPATQLPATPGEALAAAGGDLTEKMRHCPVTLPGTKTELQDVAGGIRFVLHAAAPDVVTEARRRAHALAEFTAGRSSAKHGGGKGGGFMRNCPILTKDATVIADDIEGGVQITMSPNEASKLNEFRATARERLERAPLERASVVREEASESGETRLYSGGVADLDGDGTLELIAGGFSAQADGRRSTIVVYRQDRDTWLPLTEGGWDGGGGSTIRNVEIADVDGDGKLDVVALGRIGATSHEARARLAIFDLTNGKLDKRAEVDWSDGQYTHGYGLAIGDLDRDGKPEIVTGGFQFDGTSETGFVRVWSLKRGELVVRAKTVLDGQGAPSMRINDLAIGDLGGDGDAEIVAAGRDGPLKTEDSKVNLDHRRETGDLSVLALAGDQLTVRARYSWSKGTSLRLRSVVVADLDADHHRAIVAGGQYDADGKPSLGLFALADGKLVLRDDASSTIAGVTGEVKDLIAIGRGPATRIIATGVIGDAPGRQGHVAAWRLEHGKLVSDAVQVSRNGDETRARAVVVVPGKSGSTVLTIGHAKNQTTMVGQVLRWQLAEQRR